MKANYGEPWTATQETYDGWGGDETRTIIRDSHGDAVFEPYKEQAIRIKQCVNACAGIPDPEVTIPALVEALDTLVKVEFGSLKGAQRWNEQHNGSGYWPHIINLLSKLNLSDT